MVVREHYRRQGYTVWFCEPALEKYADPDFVDFKLLPHPGRRRIGDPAFTRMQNAFVNGTVAKLNVEADRDKHGMNHGHGRTGGGDPDLFVFNRRKSFFVEVKWKVFDLDWESE